MSDNQIDSAATAGHESYGTGTEMPAWVAEDEMLIDAWRIGRRLAADKRTTQGNASNK